MSVSVPHPSTPLPLSRRWLITYCLQTTGTDRGTPNGERYPNKIALKVSSRRAPIRPGVGNQGFFKLGPLPQCHTLSELKASTLVKNISIAVLFSLPSTGSVSPFYIHSVLFSVCFFIAKHKICPTAGTQGDGQEAFSALIKD